MAASVVQVATNSNTGATVAASFATAPTPGNTVVAFINSDNVFTVAPAGGVRRFTFLADQQFDVWEFTGTLPTTVTVTPSSADYVSITLLELSGVSGFDLVGAGTSASALNLTTATAPTITTTADNDLVLDCVAIHGTSGTVPSGPSWGNGFTAAASTQTGATGNANCGQFIGSKTQTPAGAVGATTVTWTGNGLNTDAVQIAYKAAASGTNWTQTPADDTGATDPAAVQVDPSGLVIRQLTVTVSG